MSKKPGGGKHKKHGRNEKFCSAYRASGRREINKAKKLLRLLSKTFDPSAKKALENLNSVHVKTARREGRKVGAKWAELET